MRLAETLPGGWSTLFSPVLRKGSVTLPTLRRDALSRSSAWLSCLVAFENILLNEALLRWAHPLLPHNTRVYATVPRPKDSVFGCKRRHSEAVSIIASINLALFVLKALFRAKWLLTLELVYGDQSDAPHRRTGRILQIISHRSFWLVFWGSEIYPTMTLQPTPPETAASPQYGR